MNVTQFETDSGIERRQTTGLQMQAGMTILDSAKCVLASVITDATGNFSLDISSYGFSVAPYPVGYVFSTGAFPITASTLLSNATTVNFFTPTTSLIRGFVTKPNTIVIGGVGVALLSSPSTVSLILFGQ